MRRVNAVISMLILALFLFHGVVGGFQLAGVMEGGNALMQNLAHIMEAMIGLHLLIGTKLTVDTVIAMKKSGTHYYKENRLFWLRRVSGFACMVFIALHIMLFVGKNDGVYRLNFFGGLQLATQILLVLSIAVHVISNAKPMLLSFGTKSYKELGIDLAVILSGILLFTGVCFVIYYFRWKMI
ncbi:pilus assembly protein PilX [uncultured Ruminococcus sp.]|uniref:pilus assembly protein PilX n=1 Tax=uncultured Ruminococcus sp. TaxID=165186 RepID=UPI0025DC6539|nr:pilus assembly protein PilX [uncultured Ruminococcus sp.]